MIEIEVKAKIDNPSKIKEKLKEVGAKFVRTEKQTDRIFGHSMFLDSDNMMIEGGFVARIREVNNERILEFKEILRQKGGIEIESKLSDVEIGLKFLKKLGFKEAFTISKTRDLYSYNDFTICLDDVNQLGSFIEVEKMIDFSDDKNKAREECKKLLNILVPNSKIENRKYGDLIQEIINKNN